MLLDALKILLSLASAGPISTCAAFLFQDGYFLLQGPLEPAWAHAPKLVLELKGWSIQHTLPVQTTHFLLPLLSELAAVALLIVTMTFSARSQIGILGKLP